MRGFWEKNRGVKKRMELVWGKCGGSAGLCSSCEGGYKAYRVVEDVARLEEAVGGGGGAPLPAPGPSRHQPQRRDRDCVGLEGRRPTGGYGRGCAGAVGTSGLCQRSCKHFGVKNARKESLWKRMKGTGERMGVL